MLRFSVKRLGLNVHLKVLRSLAIDSDMTVSTRLKDNTICKTKVLESSRIDYANYLVHILQLPCTNSLE